MCLYKWIVKARVVKMIEESVWIERRRVLQPAGWLNDHDEIDKWIT